MTRWLRELRGHAGRALRRLGPALAFCGIVALGGCDGCGEEAPGKKDEALSNLPVPPDPPPFECGTPKLEPITSVHEHIFVAPRDIDTILAVADGVGVQKVNLLPFWDDNREAQNVAQVKAAQAQPDRLSSFVSLDPFDPEAVDKLTGHVKAGAAGVKLYSGHGRSYEEGALLGEEAMKIYAYLEREGLPLLMHVNGPRFEDKLRQLLKAHPKLVMLCPHYCLMSEQPGRLHRLLTDFPNLYTDVSFGAPHYLVAGLATLSEGHEAIRALVRHHRHRVAFGMDLVMDASKEPDKVATIARAYRDALEKEEYDFLNKKRRGLKLDDCTLESIYRVNPERFLAGKPPLKD